MDERASKNKIVTWEIKESGYYNIGHIDFTE